MKAATILIFSVVFSSVLFLFSSCGSDTPQQPAGNVDSCGDGNRRTKEYIPSALTRLPFSSVSNGRRFYDFFLEYDSLCTDQHVSADFQGRKKEGSDVKFVGKIEWAIFFERSDTGTYSAPSGGEIVWNGDVEDVGLKQAFGEDPGQVFVNVYVDIPTQGSLMADSVYLCQNVTYVAWEFVFYWHKPSSSMDLLGHHKLNDLQFDFTGPGAYNYRSIEEFLNSNEEKEIAILNLKFN